MTRHKFQTRSIAIMTIAPLVSLGIPSFVDAQALPGEVLKFQQLPLGDQVTNPKSVFPGHDELSTASLNRRRASAAPLPRTISPTTSPAQSSMSNGGVRISPTARARSNSTFPHLLRIGRSGQPGRRIQPAGAIPQQPGRQPRRRWHRLPELSPRRPSPHSPAPMDRSTNTTPSWPIPFPSRPERPTG